MISQTNVLLSGSYARGTQTPNSDMDFIVISENVTFFHTESIYFKGVEVQVIFFPKTAHLQTSVGSYPKIVHKRYIKKDRSDTPLS